MPNIINDFFRQLAWLVCQLTLTLVDWIYSIVTKVLSVNIADYEPLWKLYYTMAAFVVFFIIIRLAAMVLSAALNDQKAAAIQPMGILVRLAAVATVIALLPLVVKTLCSFSAMLVEQIGVIFGTSTDFKISDIFIRGGLNMDGGAETLDVDIWTIDINEKIGTMGSGGYRYFPTWPSLFFLLVISIAGCWPLVLIAVNTAKRILDIGYKIIISPYPISGLVNESDQSFSNWQRLLMADVMANFLQYLLLVFVMTVCMSDFISGMGFVVQSFFLIGGFLCCLTAPAGIAQIIGGDIGIAQTMQGMHTTMAAGGMISAGLTTAGAAGIYGMGRMAGGKSLLNPMSPLGGMLTGAGSGIGGAGGLGGYSTSISPQAFSEPPTDKQIYAAKKYGFDASPMSKGEASLALERVGAERSYWSGYGFGETSGAGSASSFGSAADSQAAAVNNTGKSDIQPGSQEVEAVSLAKEKSLAGAVSNFGKNGHGIAGATARVGSNMASMMYRASANRLSQQVRTSGGNVRNSRFVQASSIAHSSIEAFRSPVQKPSETKNTIQRDFVEKKGPEIESPVLGQYRKRRNEE